jgi:hypothetical protein
MRPRQLAVLLSVFASAITPALAPAGAVAEPGSHVKVTVEGDRVSVAAHAAPMRQIMRLLAERTGVEILARHAGRLEATVVVQGQPLERALAHVVRAATPATEASSVLVYDDDHKLRTAKIFFRAVAHDAVAEEPDVEAPSNGSHAGSKPDRRADGWRQALVQQLGRAGVAEEQIDWVVTEMLAEAGVPLPEIVGALAAASGVVPDGRSHAGGAGVVGPAVVEPVSEADRRTLIAELTSAGADQAQLGDDHLFLAQQLRRAGVSLQEIVDLLRTTGPELEGSARRGAGEARAVVIAPGAKGNAARPRAPSR